jgi:adenine-specific DNA-methyltransferase
VAALKRALGEHFVIEGGERYALNWAGKSDAYKVLQTPSTATLRPERDKSVNFDQAQHVFIEGENLEVLKVLQKAYFGKVKLIYIDPPYNTGSDSFIYPDRFQESKEDYLKRINDLADDGTLMREGFFRKNSKENGHYHSNWLSMMLPRLYIARNLLREDGVIFVSCDDNEVHNLRCLMNEVFGEENFVASVIWQKKQSPQNDATNFSDMHDYVLCYARYRRNSGLETRGWRCFGFTQDREQQQRFANIDDDPRGPWASSDLTINKTAEERPNLYYPIVNPTTGEEVWPARTRVWGYEQQTMQSLLREGRVWWGESGSNKPRLKTFAREIGHRIVPGTWWTREFAGDNQEAKRELRTMFSENEAAFDTPKPTRLIKRILQLSTVSGEAEGGRSTDFSGVREPSPRYLGTTFKAPPPDIVLDFFAGSATTAQAVIELNREDGGNRKVICVQLAEPVADDLDIADIARSRIRKVVERVRDTSDLATPSPAYLGFKSFVLAPSNFKQWRGDDIDTPEQLAEQMQMFAKSEKEGAAVEDMLYELLLKFGQELTTPIEPLEVAGSQVFAIHERKMLFVLESFNKAMIVPLVEMKPREIIAIDGVFNDSDMLKTNLDLQCRDAGIRFTCL